MQKGLYLTKPSNSFVVVKKTGRSLYLSQVGAAVVSAIRDTVAVDISYLKALIIPYPVLMWGKDDD